jgi:hypothetical protein
MSSKQPCMQELCAADVSNTGMLAPSRTDAAADSGAASGCDAVVPCCQQLSTHCAVLCMAQTLVT